MHFKTAVLVPLSVLATLVAAAPTIATDGGLVERADGPGHPYACDAKYNAASKKKSLTSKGASVHDLAITILETSCAMSGTAYPFGDKQPNGTPKTEDSANFGLFKNNWGMMRTYCSQFKGQSREQWKNGAALNNDDAAAIKCQGQMIAAIGRTEFYVRHRGVGGAAGGRDYGNAVEYIYNYLKDGHLTDNQVTYYTLHAV